MSERKIFSEFSKYARYVFKIIHPKFEKIGLYPGQPQLLKALQKDGEQSQKQIADTMMVKASTVTVMIQRMEKQGFIQKIQDEKDKRKTIIKITDKGVDALNKIKKVENDLDNKLSKILTEDEQETLFIILNKINNAILEKEKGEINID